MHCQKALLTRNAIQIWQPAKYGYISLPGECEVDVLLLPPGD